MIALHTMLAALLLAGSAGTRPEPLVLTKAGELGPGAKKENSGLVQSRNTPGLFWALNDSGDEPRIYPVRADGSLIVSQREPQTPGVLVGGAVNSDWEDIAADASGRIIIADFGNNSNARRDLTLYMVQEPEATAEKTPLFRTIQFRYPDQKHFPAQRGDFNFDAEALFTIGDDIYVLTKHRSDTRTKLYRLDEPSRPGVATLAYVGSFDVKGQVTAADASPDGLRLAVLTYDRIFIFERPSLSWPFFAGGVRERSYALPTGESDAESICFESPDSLLIADEATAALFRVPVSDIPVLRETPTIPAGDPASDLRIMSFNIRYAGGDRGVNSWANRKDNVARIIAHHEPDILGVQEALADQADWLRDTVHGMGFHGVGRLDGARAGEFVPILFRADRFSLLASGHFWISPTPEIPGSRGWDAACERMASWVRLRDARTGGTLLVVNTHLDHQGKEARRQGLALLRGRLPALADGASVILLGDFNTGAAGNAAAVLMGDAPPPSAPRLVDTHRAVHGARAEDEATFCGWDARIMGDRIDWIIASDDLAPIGAAIERWMPDGRTPSDHYPVVARLRPQVAPR